MKINEIDVLKQTPKTKKQSGTTYTTIESNIRFYTRDLIDNFDNITSCLMS